MPTIQSQPCLNPNAKVQGCYENGLAALKRAAGRLLLLSAFVFIYICVGTAQTKPTISGFLVDGVQSSKAAVGATLTIQGTGFGATQGFSTATLVGIALAGAGVKAKWSDTSIVCVIPLTATSGPVIVNVSEQGHNLASNPMNLAVRVEITGVSPDAGPVGTPITVDGNGFGTRGGKVTFNGVPAVVEGWGDGSLQTTVPAEATSGPIRVTVAGHVSNGWSFTITP